jgi:hypothetical protein
MYHDIKKYHRARYPSKQIFPQNLPKKIWQAARCASCTDPRASCAGGSNSRLLLAVLRLMRNSQSIMRKRQNQQDERWEEFSFIL